MSFRKADIPIAKLYESFRENKEALRIIYDKSKIRTGKQNSAFYDLEYLVKTPEGQLQWTRGRPFWDRFMFPKKDAAGKVLLDESGKPIPSEPLVNLYGLRDDMSQNRNGACLTIGLLEGGREFCDFWLMFNQQLADAANRAKDKGMPIALSKLVPIVRTHYAEDCSKVDLAGKPIPEANLKILPKIFANSKNRSIIFDVRAKNPLTGQFDGLAEAVREQDGKMMPISPETAYRFFRGGEKILAISFDMTTFVQAAKYSVPNPVFKASVDFAVDGGSDNKSFAAHAIPPANATESAATPAAAAGVAAPPPVYDGDEDEGSHQSAILSAIKSI